MADGAKVAGAPQRRETVFRTEMQATAANFERAMLFQHLVLRRASNQVSKEEYDRYFGEIHTASEGALSSMAAEAVKGRPKEGPLLAIGTRFPAFGMKVLEKFEEVGPVSLDELRRRVNSSFASALKAAGEADVDILKSSVSAIISASKGIPDKEADDRARAIISGYIEKAEVPADPQEFAALLKGLLWDARSALGADGGRLSLIQSANEFFGDPHDIALFHFVPATKDGWDSASRGFYRKGGTGFKSEEEYVSYRQSHVPASMLSTESSSAGGTSRYDRIILNPYYGADIGFLAVFMPHEYAHLKASSLHGAGDAAEKMVVSEGLAEAAALYAFRMVEKAFPGAGLLEYAKHNEWVNAAAGAGEYLYGRAIVEALRESVPEEAFKAKVIPDLIEVSSGRARLLDVVAKYVA